MKIDRLFGILTVLLQKDHVTAPYLAEKFEVTRRTITRDIDALCRAGIPIITRQGGGGGISIARGYKLDKTVLTADELASLLAAMRGIGTVTRQSQLEKTLDKLSLGQDAVLSLVEPIVIDLAAHHKGSLTEKIELLKAAIKSRRVVKFDYYYEKGVSHRRVEPVLIVFHWSSWYLFAFCQDRQDFRLFKLDRLWHATLCEETFAFREVPEDRRDFDGHLPDDQRLVALFHPSAGYQLIETYGLDCYTQTTDGRLRLEIGYTNRSFILSWLLSFGEKAEVLEPKDIAEEIRTIARKMLEENVYFD